MIRWRNIMKRALKFIIPLLIVACIAAIYFTNRASDEVIMNNGYVNGNTAGNLYNGGLFCEYNDIIYFANPSDGGKLYSMDLNGNNLQKLSEDSATYINADENYIYYIRNNIGGDLDYSFFAFHTNALCRINKDGSNIAILDTEPSMYAALLGNYIYYIHYDQTTASTLYRVRIDGEEQAQVMQDAVYTCNTDGQYFYYNGMSSDGSIHRFDTVTNTSSVIYEGNSFQPIVNDGKDIYYIDGNTDYSIVHTNLDFDNPTIVTSDSVDSYNVHGSTIYYQRYDKDGSALCMVKNDGSEKTVLMEGDFCDIHVTSHFVFFREYHSGDMYYFNRNNPTNIQKFKPAVINKK